MVSTSKSIIDYHEIIECIMGALDAKDEYTAGHSQRVSDMVLKVCELLGMCNEQKEKIHHHHERYDGLGYPDGLSGNNIPLGSRIIAICDSIDAMTSSRSYRKAPSFECCYNQIKQNLGIMYDPVIGLCVLENWDEIVCVIKNFNLAINKF